MFYYVYVLQSERDGRWYIGCTRDVFRRLQQHNQGQNKSTRYRRPFQVIFFEGFLSPDDAERRERYFKTSKGKTTIRQMLRTHLDVQGKKQ